MIGPAYTLTQTPAELYIVWTPISLFLFSIPISACFILMGSAAFFFRKQISSLFIEHLGVRTSSARSLSWTGFLLILTAVVLLIFSYQKPPQTSWRFNDKGLTIKSAKKTFRMPWDFVQSVRLDNREDISSKTSLIVTGRNQQDLWLIMKWIIPQQRHLILDYLTDRIPQKMKKITNNKDYRQSFN